MEPVMTSLPQTPLRYHAAAGAKLLAPATPDAPENLQLIVNHLPFSTTEAEVKAVFSQFGTVTRCHIIREAKSRRSKGYAFVYFQHGLDASWARHQLDGFDLRGKKMRVSWATRDGCEPRVKRQQPILAEAVRVSSEESLLCSLDSRDSPNSKTDQQS